MNKIQAKAPDPIPFGKEAFSPQAGTTVRWLGGAGALVNCRGTNILIDPVLEGFDMPLLVESPLKVEDVPQADAILLTHSDNDHFSRDTCRDLAPVCGAYHAPRYVAGLCRDMSLPGVDHNIGEPFSVGPVKITLTPADHAWQNEVPGAADRVFLPEDFCGFWLDTPDGSLWAVGDSRLLEEYLHMPTPDLMLFDFSNDGWHIGLENAVKLANAYPHTPLLLWHWGCVDAPDMDPFNGNPADLMARIQNPERALVLAPGEPLVLRRLEEPFLLGPPSNIAIFIGLPPG